MAKHEKKESKGYEKKEGGKSMTKKFGKKC
jgi:hypothetical protein